MAQIPISLARRAIVRGALLATVGSVAAAGPNAAAANPTPIMAAATRLSILSALDENDITDEQFDAVTREQLELQLLITNTAPQTIADTVVLLMIAAAEISRKALEDDGGFSHEHGEVIVRRVMHFLGDKEGLNLDDVGGAFLLPSEEQEALALSGTVAEASLRFNKVDRARALERRDEERTMTRLQVIRARQKPGEQERIERLVTEASKKWANISDDDPRFDAGRAMLARMGVTPSGAQ